MAWALGDLYDAAGLPEQAALCRSAAAHETLAVWHWIHSFPDVPTAFWLPALAALQRGAALPARAALSLSSTRALLEAVGEGLVLTRDRRAAQGDGARPRRPVPLDGGVPVDPSGG